jgi:hypothetical protein
LPIHNFFLAKGTYGNSSGLGLEAQYTRGVHFPEDFSSHPPCIFLTPQNLILPLKTSVNENRIFKNFGFHLPKFSNIEKQVFQPFIFHQEGCKWTITLVCIYRSFFSGGINENLGVKKRREGGKRNLPNILALVVFATHIRVS